MKWVRLCGTVMGLVAMIAGPAQAASFGDGGAALQDVFDSVTTAPFDGLSSVDVTTDELSDQIDSRWNIEGGENAVTTFIIELAAFRDGSSFGIYDGDGSNRAQIFAGSEGVGDQVVLSILANGNVLVDGTDTTVSLTDSDSFGFYLNVSDIGFTWFSDTSLNTDDQDHMYAYRGNNVDTIEVSTFNPSLFSDDRYILAWEDLAGTFPSSDRDFTDLVVMIQSVQPVVPEPASLALLGIGLLGLAIRRSRSRS